jgi:endonuclease G, mitochondrial
MDRDWLRSGESSDGFAWHGPANPESRPAIVDPQQKIKQIWYLEQALIAARAVGRVVIDGGVDYATCFLVAPSLILTNHHVFATGAETQQAYVEFNHRELYNGELSEASRYQFDPQVFVTDPALDFSLVGLQEPAGIPYLPLRHGQKVARNSHIAIVQHPDGQPLQVAMRDNSLVFDDADRIEYLTNTDYGSSGSPVFNDNWRVIALHSQRVRDPRQAATVWYRNRGIKIEAILRNPKVGQRIPA